MCQVTLKAADVGHVALPKDQHLVWVDRLQEEFFRQGDMERQAGLPVSAMMDRNKNGSLSSSQVWLPGRLPAHVTATVLLRAGR